jgi:recombinational DNA repair protein RecT
MAKKTALRRLSKLLPLSTTANNAFRLSELHEELSKGGRVIEGSVIEDEADAPQPAPAPAMDKPKRRRTALDEITTKAQHAPTEAAQASAGGDSGSLTVDPDTGEVFGGDLFDGPPA